MKSVRTALAVMVVAALAILVPSFPAQAYPDDTVTVSSRTVVGGEDMTITATATVPDCAWQLTYRGETRTADSGDSITETFQTPEVDKTTKDLAVATCTFDDGTGGGGQAVMALQTIQGEAYQTLLPEDNGNDNGGGLLPNTGGERLAWLIVGGFLVLIGGATVVASRRRDA